MKTIAVDVGYGYTKAVSASGKRVCFPSVTAPAHQRLLDEDAAEYRVRLKSLAGKAEEFLVGEAAARSLSSVSTLARRKPAEIHDLLLLTSAYLLGAGGIGLFPGQVNLAVGLPLAFFKAQRTELVQRLKKLAFWVSVDGGEERYISFDRVSVFPQGAGVVAAYPHLFAEGLVGVVDIGQYTTDFLLVEKRPGSSAPKPLLDACGSAEVGAHLVHRAVMAEFQAETGCPLPQEMCEEALKGGCVFFEGRKIDLRQAAESAVADAARAVSQKVISSWGNRANFVRSVLLVGGGALLLKGELEKYLPCASYTPDPVFANAFGFLRALGVETGTIPAGASPCAEST